MQLKLSLLVLTTIVYHGIINYWVLPKKIQKKDLDSSEMILHIVTSVLLAILLIMTLMTPNCSI